MKKLIFLLLITIGYELSSQCVYEWGTTSSSTIRLGDAMQKDPFGNIIVVTHAGESGELTKYSSSGAIVATVTWTGMTSIYNTDCYVDVNGFIYITGGYSGTLYFGPFVLTEAYGICQQIFVAKISPMGNVIWVTRSSGNYGASADGSDWGTAVTADFNGDCYLLGEYSASFVFGSYDLDSTGGNTFVAKLDGLTGTVTWLQVYDANSMLVSKIKACRDGRFYRAANFGTDTFVDSTTAVTADIVFGANLFVAMYDEQGNLQWHLNSTGQGYIQAITTDSHENLVISGIVTDSLSLGSKKIYSMGEKGIFCIKIDTLGTVLQLERIISGSDLSDEVSVAPYGLDTDSLDNVFVCGDLRDEVNFNGIATTDVVASDVNSYAVKFDNTFTPVWYNTFATTVDDYVGGLGIVKLDNKNVYVAGAYDENIVLEGTAFNFAGLHGHTFMAELCDETGSFTTPLSVDENGPLPVTIAPNPAKSSVKILNLPENVTRIEIYNITGQLMFLSALSIETIDLSSPNFKSGIYFLKIFKEDGFSVSRFQIQKD